MAISASALVGTMTPRNAAPASNGPSSLTPNQFPNSSAFVSAFHTRARGAFNMIRFSIRSLVATDMCNLLVAHHTRCFRGFATSRLHMMRRPPVEPLRRLGTLRLINIESAGHPHGRPRIFARAHHDGPVYREGHGAHRRQAPVRQQHVPPSDRHARNPARLQDDGSRAAQGIRDSRSLRGCRHHAGGHRVGDYPHRRRRPGCLRAGDGGDHSLRERRAGAEGRVPAAHHAERKPASQESSSWRIASAISRRWDI